MSYGDTYLRQHWFRLWLVAWRPQAITWTKVDFSSARFCGIHLRPISQWVLKRLFYKMSFKMIFLKPFPYLPGAYELTHWGRVTHICVIRLAIIGSDNGLSPDRRQAIIWTNDGKSLIGPLGITCSEILIGIQTFSFKKMHLNMSSAKWRPFCPGLDVLRNNTCSMMFYWCTLSNAY